MTKKLPKKYKRIFTALMLMALMSTGLPLFMVLMGGTYIHIIAVQLILLTLWFLLFLMFYLIDMLKKIKGQTIL